jgi:hypothetical protein
MAYNVHRANVRNFLVGLTLAECRDWALAASERGDTESAGYANEFISELEDELDDSPSCDDCTFPAAYF